MKTQQGFTLVELMISIAIFALLVTMAYQSVNLLMDANQRIQAPQADFQALQRAMVILERDLQQLVNRKQTTGFGEQNAALSGNSESDMNTLLEFTRGGNPDIAWELRKEGQMRSTLQRVRYVLENKTLVRQSWNLVDHVDNDEPVSMPLLTQVKAIKFRFQAAKGEDFKDMPPTGEKLPVAIEISLEHERFGLIRRIFLIYI